MDAVEAITEKCQQCFVTMATNDKIEYTNQYAILEVIIEAVVYFDIRFIYPARTRTFHLSYHSD